MACNCSWPCAGANGDLAHAVEGIATIDNVSLTPKVRDALLVIVQAGRTPRLVARRGMVILELDRTKSESATARSTGVMRSAVGKWRGRWLKRHRELDDLSGAKLRRRIVEILSDKRRQVTRSIITPEQVARIIALACEPPVVAGVAVGQWTHASLAEEAIRRGIVAAVSRSSVGRFLKSGRPTASQGQALAEPA